MHMVSAHMKEKIMQVTGTTAGVDRFRQSIDAASRHFSAGCVLASRFV